MSTFDLIGFDADDTLWENEALYAQAREQFKDVLAKYEISGPVDDLLDEIEIRNLKFYGYGVMGFVLSLVETGIEGTAGRISAADVRSILALSKKMIAADVQLLRYAEPTLRELAAHNRLMLITKGDLLHQHSKLARSGLRNFFSSVEVVSDKTPEVYTEILARHGAAPERFLMVGNSMRSDILPVLEIGGWAVYVPSELTWSHEQSELPGQFIGRCFELEHLGLLPAWLADQGTSPRAA